MFSVQISLVPSAVKAGARRGVARSEVQMPGRVGDDGIRSVCRVSDLSIAGARLETYQALAPHSVVMLTLPGQPARRARIVWSDDYHAGCAFDEPLFEAVLDQLVAIYGFVPALPEIAMFRA
ncbi:PilZ domain-containing protein [Sphingomonas sp. HMP6]|uniref:PilZ domain-containing protein n=1 Tax=Sphingomonas sp. HMP6 TaxID=1517551 RepID=UPI0015970453|nr:PilZ domain-containing protein [Sphingomonas sp. HMP6]BCA58197.1 hypothetical protein HMP06_0966 [Sphingomonas sp. HMP6]